ncbi:hypothetical protein PISL3812_04263 [Talaromyces islandicus]|uniref:Carrier domain-containing protein n=1 Tax=Talaromyces islandicus TaxID=28573 RepID=A0A0U1LWT7_TALIS|nr:hypothetical protein PISL3812_04263 [Talaromyces islandicus]
MYDSDRPHPLLAQVPLTVSPFISLPTAVTLPYTYKSVASALPPSITVNPASAEDKARYVVSSTGGHAAHPDEILASYQSLEEHLHKTMADAKKAIADWEESVKQRDLAEKRRLAPGWLDREEKLLQPAPPSSSLHGEAASPSILDSSSKEQELQSTPAIAPRDEGEELDRAFGVDSLKATDVRNWVLKEFKSQLSIFDVLRPVPVSQLALTILNKSSLMNSAAEIFEN